MAETSTPTTAGMPGEFFAKNAQNSTRARDAQVGMPSEEEIADAIVAAIEASGFLVVVTSADKNGCRLIDGDVDMPGISRAILSLIRPAFEALAEQAHYANGVAELAMKHRDEAEAKLAQAVEAMEPFDDALGEDDEGYGGGLTVVMKWGACTDYSVTLQDLRDLRQAARAASARGETT